MFKKLKWLILLLVLSALESHGSFSVPDRPPDIPSRTISCPTSRRTFVHFALFVVSSSSDPSGSLQGAGGVGGLLCVIDGRANPQGEPYFPCFDANGNIVQYIDDEGNIVAAREYSPFGETTSVTGSMQDDFTFWFSTKYWDIETGLGYWGMRYYHPEQGRWLSRDPLGEEGGLNLYGACENNMLNSVDPLGMDNDVSLNMGGQVVHLDINSMPYSNYIGGDWYQVNTVSKEPDPEPALLRGMKHETWLVPTKGFADVERTYNLTGALGSPLSPYSPLAEQFAEDFAVNLFTAPGFAFAEGMIVTKMGKFVTPRMRKLLLCSKKGGLESRALKLPAADPALSGTRTIGYTTPDGSVFLQPNLSRAEQLATLRHESVHAFFSPRGSGPVAVFRQRLGQFAYDNSQLLRFAEESIAETYSSGSLIQGMSHPFVNGYGITAGGLATEGAIYGGTLFGAGYLGYEIWGGE